MDDILTCGICRSEFSTPKQLQCGHVFCFKCIERDYQLRNRNNGRCPICGQEYWPSRRDVDSLPKCSFPLLDILSLRKYREQHCENSECLKNPAPFICIRCRQWLCDNCKSKKICSENGNSLGSHEAFQPHELEQNLFDIVVRSRHRSCREHPRKDVKWYCGQCKTLVCYLCKINLHTGHGSLITMEAKAQECRVHLETDMKLLKQKQSEHTKNKATLTELISTCHPFVNAKHCYTEIEHCQIGFQECENLKLLISKLLENGSMKVVIETSLNIEERMKTELEKRLILEKVREVIVSKPEPIEQEEPQKGDDNRTQSNDNSCENYDSSAGVYGESCESTRCTSEERVFWICKRCKKWLCGSCKSMPCESGISGDRMHLALNASNLDTTLYDILIRSKQNSCPTDPDYDVESYCSRCHVITCKSCRHRHDHHQVVTIAARSKSCRTIIDEKQKELKNIIADYSITKEQVLKIESGCPHNIFHPKYFQNMSSECSLRGNKCDDLDKILSYLLSYASEKVLVEKFDTLEKEIEQELRMKPSLILSDVRQVVNVVSATLRQTSGIDDTAFAKQQNSKVHCQPQCQEETLV